MNIFFKNICFFLILVSVFSSSVGIASMHTDDIGQMTGCPFMGTEAVCQMGVFEHIRIFQSMFSGIPVKTFLSILLLFLIVTLAVTVVASRINSPPNELKSFTKEILNLSSFNRILRALSDGRIQLKIYA